jgi:hypothetical protein
MKNKLLSELSGPFTYVPPKNRTGAKRYEDVDPDLANDLKVKLTDLFLVKLRQVGKKFNLKTMPTFLFGLSRSEYVDHIIESYWRWVTYLAHECKLTIQRIGRRKYDEFNNLSGECIISLASGDAYIYTYARLTCTVVSNPVKRWLVIHLPKWFSSYDAQFRSFFEIVSRIYIDPVHYYELIIKRIPLNTNLITDTSCNLVHEGFEEYERREEVYRSRKSVSRCRVCPNI